MKIAISILAITFALLNSGCATLKGWFGMNETKPEKIVSEIKTPKFSENQNLLVPVNRNYKRMTRSRMEEDSDLTAQAGSMWVMEGQGAYLFAQNKSRKEGDLLNIKIDGAAQKQVETKVSVIKKLLKQLEEQELQQQQQNNPETQPKLADGKAAAEPARAPAADSSGKKEKDDDVLNLDSVATRIVERLADGNYRIKGQQPFMIGKREYKVIVTGLIRPEDFNDEGISSSKLLDPQFDVVSLRKKNTEVN
jgi:flagellar L-ring protein precursor FlgH